MFRYGLTRFLRFSLGTLVLAVLLLGSSVSLWMNAQAWRLQSVIQTGDPPEFAAFSADEQRIVWCKNNWVHVADARSGEELKRIPEPAAALLQESLWNGRPVAVTARYTELDSIDTIDRRDFRAAFPRTLTLDLVKCSLAEKLDMVKALLKLKWEPGEGVNESGKLEQVSSLNVNQCDALAIVDLIAHGSGLQWRFRKGVLKLEMPDANPAVDVATAIRFWDLETGELLVTSPPLPKSPEGIFVSASGNSVVASFPGGKVSVWDARSPQQLANLEAQLITVDVNNRPESELTHAAIGADGTRILGHFSFADDFTELDLKTGESKSRMIAPSNNSGVAWSSNQKYACIDSSKSEKTPELWDIERDVQISKLSNSPVAQQRVSAPAFSPTDDRLVVHSQRETHLLLPESGAVIKKFNAFRNARFAFRRRIFALADFGSGEIRESERGELLTALPQAPRTPAGVWAGIKGMFAGPAPVSTVTSTTPFRFDMPALQFSSDDTRLLASCGSNSLGVWVYQRPESWWGIACLPVFWSTIIFAAALGWNLRKRRGTGNVSNL